LTGPDDDGYSGGDGRSMDSSETGDDDSDDESKEMMIRMTRITGGDHRKQRSGWDEGFTDP
jgi:hypothetical protein